MGFTPHGAIPTVEQVSHTAYILFSYILLAHVFNFNERGFSISKLDPTCRTAGSSPATRNSCARSIQIIPAASYEFVQGESTCSGHSCLLALQLRRVLVAAVLQSGLWKWSVEWQCVAKPRPTVVIFAYVYPAVRPCRRKCILDFVGLRTTTGHTLDRTRRVGWFGAV